MGAQYSENSVAWSSFLANANLLANTLPPLLEQLLDPIRGTVQPGRPEVCWLDYMNHRRTPDTGIRFPRLSRTQCHEPRAQPQPTRPPPKWGPKLSLAFLP